MARCGCGTWPPAGPIGHPLRDHADLIFSVAFSPDGKTLASGSEDGPLRQWDVATGRPIGHPLPGHTAQIFSVALSPDDKALASGSDDGTVRLWDVTTGRPLTGHTTDVTSVAFSPDGKTRSGWLRCELGAGAQ